jgi:integrase
MNARRKAGLEGVARFHDTRASFCSYLAQLGVNILDIQKLAGHESVQTTMRYIGVGNMNLRNAVDLLAKMRPLEVQKQTDSLSEASHTKSHTESGSDTKTS